MLRVLAILLFAINGLAHTWMGLSMGACDGCGHGACIATPVETGCCGEPDRSEDFCPASDGPCTCKVSPAPERAPTPETPLPLMARDSLTAVPSAPVDLETLIEPEGKPARGSSVSVSLLSGLTHNEIQALLGIWRT